MGTGLSISRREHRSLLRALMWQLNQSKKNQLQQTTMAFKIGNLMSRSFIMKLIELVCVCFLRTSSTTSRKRFSGVWSHRASCVSSGQLWGHDNLGLRARVGAKKPPSSIPRILQYPNPPGAPTFYPERPENDLILGLLVSPGYFFITLVLLVGLALGDASEYGVSPHHCPFLKLFPFLCSLNFFCFSSSPFTNWELQTEFWFPHHGRFAPIYGASNDRGAPFSSCFSPS